LLLFDWKGEEGQQHPDEDEDDEDIVPVHNNADCELPPIRLGRILVYIILVTSRSAVVFVLQLLVLLRKVLEIMLVMDIWDGISNTTL
jgi:hypothetical protein